MSAQPSTPYDAWLQTLIVGESIEIRRLRALVVRVARTTLPVLIAGPTGVGKELVAEAIHRISGRAGQIVAVNICAISESMFESTLFGHRRGAFTGAMSDSSGLVAEADHGTLFLDEIGALPLREQAKLLRVLETRSYRPLGASRECVSDFRLLAATNENLEAAVGDDRFREDLLYRLGRIVVRVPALTERRDDIPMLVRHFANGAAHDGPLRLDDAAMSALVAHDWPGNVRELRNIVATLSVMHGDAAIGRREVNGLLRGEIASVGHELRTRDVTTAREILHAMLEQSAWDTSEVAAQLGIHRVTVYRRMRALGLSAPSGSRFRSADALDADAQICANEHVRDANRANGVVRESDKPRSSIDLR